MRTPDVEPADRPGDTWELATGIWSSGGPWGQSSQPVGSAGTLRSECHTGVL